jgi:hypothetical protein
MRRGLLTASGSRWLKLRSFLARRCCSPPTDEIEPGSVDLTVVAGVRTIPDGPNAAGVDVAWLPDSSALLFANGAQVDLVTVPNGERHLLIEDGYDPAVSPDGDEIAYLRAGASDGVVNIWVAAADGSNAHRVASSSTRPVWSPHSSVLLASDDEGWFSVRPDGTERTTMAPFLPPGHLTICCPDNRPSWQPLHTPADAQIDAAPRSTAGAQTGVPPTSTAVASAPPSLVLDTLSLGRCTAGRMPTAARATGTCTTTGTPHQLVNVFHTAESDPAVLEPTEIAIDVSEHAGKTVRVRLAEVGNQAPIRASVDNIRFEPRAAGAGIKLPDTVDATVTVESEPGADDPTGDLPPRDAPPQQPGGSS